MSRRKNNRQLVIKLDGDLTEDLMALAGKYVTMSFTSAKVDEVKAAIVGNRNKDIVTLEMTIDDLVLTETTPPE